MGNALEKAVAEEERGGDSTKYEIVMAFMKGHKPQRQQLNGVFGVDKTIEDRFVTCARPTMQWSVAKPREKSQNKTLNVDYGHWERLVEDLEQKEEFRERQERLE